MKASRWSLSAHALCCPQQEDGAAAGPVGRADSSRGSNSSIGGGGGGGGLMGEMNAILARRWVTSQTGVQMKR